MSKMLEALQLQETQVTGMCEAIATTEDRIFLPAADPPPRPPRSTLAC